MLLQRSPCTELKIQYRDRIKAAQWVVLKVLGC